MPAGVQSQWRTWANNHDWGQRNPAWIDAQGMHVEAIEYRDDGSDAIVPFIAKTPRDLRDWAGY
jgi:hypothetical protein